MAYDFSTLSPLDFEELTRDLLQEKLGIILEGFCSTKDQGIDFRFSCGNKNIILVQAKHYTDFSTLYNSLKIEKKKIEQHNPNRYILSTSHNLTKGQTDKIFLLLQPYIINMEDIVGRNMLNNLLGKYKDIELKHFKLWLTSTNILQRLMYNRIYKQTDIEIEKMKKTIKLYVANNSFVESQKILKDNRCLIISGPPGIGKTTLARALILFYIKQRYNLISISSEINEAYDLINDKTKQLFFFDDFLGSNFLSNKLSRNEEKRIVDLINSISKRKNKLFILTTREYILNQARQEYECLDGKEINIKKYIMDISQYTKLIKAKILYNHLYFSELKKEYIHQLLIKDRYLDIIKHKNYSPRLIEKLTDISNLKGIDSTEYYDYFIKNLDHPELLWQHAYENTITPLSRTILLIMMTCGSEVFIDDLEKAVKNYLVINKEPNFTHDNFRKSLKELDESFICTVINKDKKHVILFSNTSIVDYLLYYISNDKSCQNNLLNGAIFFNQFFEIFVYRKYYISINKVFLDNDQRSKVIQILEKNFDELECSLLSHTTPDKNNHTEYSKRIYTMIDKYYQFSDSIGLSKSPILEDRIINTIFTNIDDLLRMYSWYKVEKILRQIDRKKISQEFINDLIIKKYNSLDFIEELTDFFKIENIFPKQHKKFIKSNKPIFEKTMYHILDNALDGFSSLDEPIITDYLDKLSEIPEKYNLNKYRIEWENRLLEIQEKEETANPEELDEIDEDSINDDGKDNDIKHIFDLLEHF